MAEPTSGAAGHPTAPGVGGTPAPSRFPLWAVTFGAMVAGIALGSVMGPRAALLGELGLLVIQVVKAVATPLLFLAILHAVLTTRIEGPSALRMLAIAILNVTIALSIGLAVSNLFHPGEHLSFTLSPESHAAAQKYAEKKVDFLATLKSYVPTDFVKPFAENLVIGVILIALALGFGLRKARRDLEAEGRGAAIVPLVDGIGALLRAVEAILGGVIYLVPFAVFAVAARAVGEQGFAPLKGLLVYVVAGVGGLALHVAVTYHAWILLIARIPFRRFWAEAREPVITALGVNSSLATLPLTLRALDRLGISRASSTLGACVGTNLNNDGIVLYEGMAVLFVAQASGIHLGLGQQILAALICIVAAMGVAGVPEAGFVSLALVLNTTGLPIELLPLLLAVDWIIARARSATNVLSDMVLSIAIDRFAKGAPEPGTSAPRE